MVVLDRFLQPQNIIPSTWVRPCLTPGLAEQLLVGPALAKLSLVVRAATLNSMFRGLGEATKLKRGEILVGAAAQSVHAQENRDGSQHITYVRCLWGP